MPELPEVEAVRVELQPHLEGARIETVEVRRAALRRPFPVDFAARLEGQTIRTLTRRGKYLLAELTSGDILVMHLGMSGSFRVEHGSAREGEHSSFRRGDPPGSPDWRARDAASKHDHVVFALASGTAVIFNDPRRFGSMTVLSRDETPRYMGLGTIGPEPLTRAFTAATLARALAGRKSPIKVALLDQDVVAGVGNIYACEALHRARISPRRLAGMLATRTGAPRTAAVELAAAIKKVLRDGVSPDAPDFRVYSREGDQCLRPRCGGRVRRIEQAGRSTFYCPRCQRT